MMSTVSDGSGYRHGANEITGGFWWEGFFAVDFVSDMAYFGCVYNVRYFCVSIVVFRSD